MHKILKLFRNVTLSKKKNNLNSLVLSRTQYVQHYFSFLNILCVTVRSTNCAYEKCHLWYLRFPSSSICRSFCFKCVLCVPPYVHYLADVAYRLRAVIDFHVPVPHYRYYLLLKFFPRAFHPMWPDLYDNFWVNQTIYSV